MGIFGFQIITYSWHLVINIAITIWRVAWKQVAETDNINILLKLKYWYTYILIMHMHMCSFTKQNMQCYKLFVFVFVVRDGTYKLWPLCFPINALGLLFPKNWENFLYWLFYLTKIFTLPLIIIIHHPIWAHIFCSPPVCWILYKRY